MYIYNYFISKIMFLNLQYKSFFFLEINVTRTCFHESDTYRSFCIWGVNFEVLPDPRVSRSLIMNNKRMHLEAFVGAYCFAQTHTFLIRSMNGCQRTCLCAACVGTFKMRPLKVFMKQTQQTKWRLRCSWLSHRELLWHRAVTILPWRPDCDALRPPCLIKAAEGRSDEFRLKTVWYFEILWVD